MTTQMTFNGFGFGFLAPVKATPVAAPRKFGLAAVRSLLSSESRKREGGELGRGQAMQAAAEFVARIVLKNHRQSPEFESMMGACLLHMEAGYLKRPGATEAGAKRETAERMARIEGKPSTPPEKTAPTAPVTSPKFSVDTVTSLMRRTEDAEAQAAALIKRVSGDNRYTTEERGEIVDAIRVGIITPALKRGATFADAERTANAICAAPKADARRPRPKPAQGTPVYKPGRGEHAAPKATQPTDADKKAHEVNHEVNEEALLKAIDAQFEKLASQPPPPAGSSIPGRSADEIAAHHARVKAAAEAKAERRLRQLEAEAKAQQGKAAAEAKAEAERRWRADMKAKAAAEAQNKKSKKASRGAHAQAT